METKLNLMEDQALSEELGRSREDQYITVVERGQGKQINLGVGADEERLERSNGEQLMHRVLQRK